MTVVKEMMEEYGIVLDYLSMGRSNDLRREPIAHIIGEQFFTLLEVVTKKDAEFKIGDRIYIGREIAQRDKVDRIKGRIDYVDLTTSARSELPTALKKIVSGREQELLNFFNKCGAISIRQHQLELLPGIGKKHLEEILTEREKKPFESFEDMHSRIHSIAHPEQLIVERIIEELKGSRYYIFTRPPHVDRPWR